LWERIKERGILTNETTPNDEKAFVDSIQERMRQMKIQNEIYKNLESYPHIKDAFGGL
jgi:hypothetical protein